MNYGWDCREGAHNYSDPNGDMNVNCPVASVDPVLEYSHSLGCSVTGGFVYRGLPASTLLSGNYVFGDYCSGRIWRGIHAAGGGWTNPQLPLTATSGLTSFGQGETGRLYVTYSNGTLKWLVPYTFSDVNSSYWAWPFIEAIAASGISGGCGTDVFCPEASLNRAQAAVLLVRAVHGSTFTPPAASGTVFTDVPSTYWAASFVEQVAADGVARGCGVSQFCPDDLLTRAQAAVLLLRAKHGSSYTPPPGTGTLFSDVPASYWAVSWVEQLAAEGISGGCGGGNFCPDRIVTRAEAAVLFAKAFNLPTP